MRNTVSVYLDLLRAGAALLVAYGHFTLTYFSDGWTELANYGVAAVAVFFVLSGFVISHATEVKETDLVSYAVARLARLYSVLVPALVFSVLVAFIAYAVRPDYAAHWLETGTPLILRIIASLTFTSEAYGADLVPWINYPIWSLGYEAPFYIAFGIWHFLRGMTRIWLLALLVAIIGPNVFMLFGPWVAGAWLHRFLRRRSVSKATGLACLVGAVLIAVAYPLYLSASADAIRDFAEPVAFLWRGRSAAFMVFYTVTVIAVLSIIAVHALHAEVAVVLRPFTAPIRVAASATFTLYLFHFPMFVLIYALTGYDRTSWVEKCLALATGLFACLLLSRVIEARKSAWARGIRLLFVWSRLGGAGAASRSKAPA